MNRGMNASAVARNERNSDASSFIGALGALRERFDAAAQAVAIRVAEAVIRNATIVLTAAFEPNAGYRRTRLPSRESWTIAAGSSRVDRIVAP
jgi:hypothetical protein